MSMSKEECMHDCTCCATVVKWENGGDVLFPVEVHCDLPESHAPGSRHWDPTWGWWESE